MANLPDLNTATMGLTGFWDVNANVTAADMTNIVNNLASFTTYDNGVDGTVRVSLAGAIDNLNGRYLFRVRVRTDGTILVWGLRADDPDLLGTATAAIRTVAGVGYPATRGSLLPQSQTGTRSGSVTLWALLCDAIENLMTTTPFKTVVNTATVGHYDFQYPTMTKIYVLGEELGGVGSNSFTFTQPSSGNGILMVAFHFSKFSDINSINGGSPNVQLNCALNAVAVNDGTGGNDVDYGLRYYTLAPNHTNWPLAAVSTVNNFSMSISSNNVGIASARMVTYLVLYAVET